MNTEAVGNPDATATARHLRAAERPAYAALGDRWAVVVGVSRYQDARLNLRYADRDAEEFCQLLQTPSGGGFEKARIRELINEQATTAAVARALRSFLKQPAPEDLVLIYFACHGAPDPDRPHNLYLLTHDTDPDDVAGSALPMREVYLALTETLLAKRVVVIADTCHSAALSGVTRRSPGNDAQAINAYLKEAGKAKGGVALLTSAEASESAQEDQQWGGGHGVFTHFLLQGMRGDADGYKHPKDGKVTIRELFEYVRDNVIRSTGSKQHPAIGNYFFDDNLPLAITGGIDARAHYELGCRLYELGRQLDDAGRFRSAAGQFREAIQLSRITGEPFPEAELGLGKALAATGDYEGAIRTLSSRRAREAESVMPEALLHLGVAYARRDDMVAAAANLEEFLKRAPQDENAAWVRAYLEWLTSSARGRRYALLIGINQYRHFPKLQLRGCTNDAELMRQVLTERCGFMASDITTLLDQDATRAGILRALAELSRRVTPDDIVVVHYSGHSVSESHPEVFGAKPGDTYLVVHDTRKKAGSLHRGISPVELHGALKAIPAGRKTLILDTHPYTQFTSLVEADDDYELLLASDTAEMTAEILIEDGRMAGAFTWGLTRCLATADPQRLTYGQLIDAALAAMPAFGRRQTPILFGDREQLVFAVREIYLRLFSFAERRNYEAYTLAGLKARYSRFRQRVTAAHPLAHYSFGRAFLEAGDYDAAAEALRTALAQGARDEAAGTLALGKAQLSARLYDAATTSFRRYAELAPAEVGATARELIARTETLIAGHHHALLVGINDYLSPQVRRVRGAVNDVRALHDVLVSKLEFDPANVTVLLDRDATRAAILAAFSRLVESARTEPALFFFAGNGSLAGDAPTLVSADGRQDGVEDIAVSELAALAAGVANLVTILDAGWTGYAQPANGLRTIAADGWERPAGRGLGITEDRHTVDAPSVCVGGLTIYSANAVNRPAHGPPPLLESDTERIVLPPPPPQPTAWSGLLTRALVRALEDAGERRLTYDEWLRLAGEPASAAEEFVTAGDGLHGPIFDNHTARAEAFSHLTRLEQEPITQTITLLSRMIEQREQQNNLYPEGRLNLGVAYVAVGDYERGLPLLERAVALYTDPTVFTRELEHDPYAEAHYHDAHYQLGRALLASGRDYGGAVSQLKEAVRLNPENARAYYFLGQAIRAMVEHETLARAEEALQSYLAKGAPLGHEDEVREFLGLRSKPPLTR
jgi:tetratricopeptide (TPR) repeat protein